MGTPPPPGLLTNFRDTQQTSATVRVCTPDSPRNFSTLRTLADLLGSVIDAR